MKKACITFIIISLLVSGCGREIITDESKTVNIVTSFYPIYIFTLNIIEGVEGVGLTNMTKSDTGCLHNYRLLPEDMRLLEEADVFVINGAGMEGFIDKTIETKKQLKVVDSSEKIELIYSEHDHSQCDHDHDQEENSHIWMSIPNAVQQVENIAKGLAEADSENASAYITNAAKYTTKLEVLDAEIKEKVAGINNRELITFHEAFPYFADEYGFKIAGVVGETAENDPSAKTLASIIEIIREKNIKALFTEPNYPPKSAEVISKETGAIIYSLDPIVSGDMTPDAYEKAMRKNIEAIARALGI